MPRRHQLADALGTDLPAAADADQRPWHTVVMSRLGRNLLARRFELATLYRWIEQSSDCGDVPMAVPGTAAHPWVNRACELLGISPIEIGLAGDAPTSDRDSGTSGRLVVQSRATTIKRDHLAVMLADRVDVAFVRPHGTVHQLLLQRLLEDRSGSVRVLIPVESWGQNTSSRNVIDQLVAAGAIGYCCRWESDVAESRLIQEECDLSRSSAAMHSLLEQPQRWLIHWTRGRSGAWPGQSEQQFRDGLLLSCPQPADLTPLATLKRIVAQRQLVGTAQTIAGSQPVVCFTAMSLYDVIQRRVFRPHLGRWDAEPYGLAIDLDTAKQLGAQPVMYVDEHGRPDSTHAWRLQARGKTYDWTAEQEWRLPGIADLRDVAPEHAVVYVERDEEITKLRNVPWPVISIQSLLRIAH
jgi:hypothetical protein